jgi:hypothetical protein
MAALGDHPQAEVPARLDDRRRLPDGLAARGMGPSAAVRGALLAVAGVLTIAVVGLGALLVQTTTRAERLEQQLADAGSSDVASLLALPDARVADLDAPAGTSARFVYSPERNRGILVSHGLSPLPADRSPGLRRRLPPGRTGPGGGRRGRRRARRRPRRRHRRARRPNRGAHR